MGNINKKLLLFSFILFVLLFSVITVLFWSFVSTTILIPVYYIFGVCFLLINSVSQETYLTVLLFLGIGIGIQTVKRFYARQPHQHRAGDQHHHADTRYWHWRVLCADAHGNWLAKSRLAAEARSLVLSVLAFEQNVNLAEAEALIRNRIVPVPDILRQVVETKSIPNESPRHFFRRRRSKPDTDPQVEQLLAVLMNFVEQQLEKTTYAGNKHDS